MQGAERAPVTTSFRLRTLRACEKNIGGLRRYYDILGFGVAGLVLLGIVSMETVCVKPAEMLVKALLWPVTLMEAVVNYSSTHHNYKAAL